MYAMKLCPDTPMHFAVLESIITICWGPKTVSLSHTAQSHRLWVQRSVPPGGLKASFRAWAWPFIVRAPELMGSDIGIDLKVSVQLARQSLLRAWRQTGRYLCNREKCVNMFHCFHWVQLSETKFKYLPVLFPELPGFFFFSLPSPRSC